MLLQSYSHTSLFLLLFVFVPACKICLRPFTTFRWRPGGKGKHRTTEICQTCSKLRNACQSCILDLVYHLPIQIRDQINPNTLSASQPVQTSDVHREYFADQAERAIQSGEVTGSQYAHVPAVPKMVGVARTMAPYFAKMGIHGIAGAESGEFDPNNCSLYLGGADETIGEADIRLAFQQYSGITRVKLVPKIRAAFVDFVDRDSAEAAYSGCGGTVAVGVSKKILQVSWSKGGGGGGSNRGRGRDNQVGVGVGGAAAGGFFGGVPLPPPPPGVAPPPGVRPAPAHMPASAVFYPSASGNLDGSAPVNFNRK